jgi:hypothetical protein
MCSLNVRFIVECVFDVIFGTENDIKNAFDTERHIQTAHPKRRCNRPLKGSITRCVMMCVSMSDKPFVAEACDIGVFLWYECRMPLRQTVCRS